jgi:hypothetical protein
MMIVLIASLENNRLIIKIVVINGKEKNCQS